MLQLGLDLTASSLFVFRRPGMRQSHERPSQRALSVLGILVALCTAAVSVEAQDRPVHQRSGVWVVIGIGSAHNDLWCEGCSLTDPDDGWRGGSGAGAIYGIGGAITPRWLAGVEFNPTGRGAGSWTERGSFLFMLLGVVQFYPKADGGLHFNLGTGPISVSLSGEGGGAENVGLAVRLGAGYDVRFRWMRSFALTPYASHAVTRVREAAPRTSGNGSTITELDNRKITQAGIALRWY